MRQSAPSPLPLRALLNGPTSDFRPLTVEGFDEILEPTEGDFQISGLKSASVIRVGRLAVVGADVLLGAIGEIMSESQ